MHNYTMTEYGLSISNECIPPLCTLYISRFDTQNVSPIGRALFCNKLPGISQYNKLPAERRNLFVNIDDVT